MKLTRNEFRKRLSKLLPTSDESNRAWGELADGDAELRRVLFSLADDIRMDRPLSVIGQRLAEVEQFRASDE